MSLNSQILSQRTGLATLIGQLEAGLGSEAQDSCRAAGKNFSQYKRPPGLNAAEFLVTFESLYWEAVTHGLAMNQVMLSQKLLESLNVSSEVESRLLDQVGGNYSDYVGLRRAIRRHRGLDTRHDKDALMYPTNQDGDGQQQAFAFDNS